MKLTYPPLGDDAAELIGQPFGMDSDEWPYIVEAVEHTDTATVLTLEPWPLPGPGEIDEWMSGVRAAADRARTAAIRCASVPFLGSKVKL